jgi:predicted 3-demethylubiquinone-9 3-methyltransferase (glyoxalase superfamily)
VIDRRVRARWPALHGLNAGPQFAFNEAVSFFVGCDSQEEIDDLWAKLTADGGEPGRCGWLKDRFGLSWQVVPKTLGQFVSGGGDPAASKRVMDAFFQNEQVRYRRASGGVRRA